MLAKVNIAQKLSQFNDHWNPKIVGEINDSAVKLAKLKGEFVWHSHEHEDEMFLVIQGRLLIKFRDQDMWLDEGEFVIIPHGVEHCPVADEEVYIMLFEPKSTLNTGTAPTNKLTVEDLDHL